MDEEEKKTPENEEEEEAKTPAEIMREMKAEYEGKLAEKDKEIETLKSKHTAEIRDILTGKDVKANQEMDFDARVKAEAERLRKIFGN
jgi:hypothetical protein